MIQMDSKPRKIGLSAAQIGQLFKKAGTPPSPSPAQRGHPPHGSNQVPKSRSRQTPRTSTGGPCLGARGKQAQLAQANESKFNLLLMLVAQMSTYPRVIATHYCSWGSRKFKLTHGALTAFEDLGVQPRRPCSPWTLRLTTFVVVISSWDLMVTSTGSRACESKPHKVGNVRASEHPGDDSPAWGSCEFPGGVNSPPRVLPSTNNGLVSTRGARRALLPHLIAHSGAGFAFSQKEDFRRSMSSWLARAADLLARVAMNRLRLAFCSRASSQLPRFFTRWLLRLHRGEAEGVSLFGRAVATVPLAG